MANHVWVETRTPMAHVKTRSETMKTQARMTMGHVVGARFFDENVPIITINRGEVVPSFGSCPGGSDKSVRADVAPALRSAPADAEPRFGPCQWREKGREKGRYHWRPGRVGHGQDGHATTVGAAIMAEAFHYVLESKGVNC